jgi:RNA polymerase sigma-70 factor (ECF subfamily)
MALTPTTRASLLSRLADRQDHEAWVEFVSLYEPMVYRLLRRHGLQDADAGEVVQDLFLAVSRSIDRWIPDRQRGSFRGWLRRVTRNLMINWLKARGRRVVAVGGSNLQEMLEQVPAACGPESAEFDRELRRAVFRRAAEQVRSEVQPATWQAFWETAVVGASPADAAQKLGMQPGAVRVAKCRVLVRLRAAIDSLEE